MGQSNYLEKSKAYKGYHYSVLDSKELEYLHNRTLEMFKQVKSIFEKNNIRYMICGGTLLGAIGNGHFIPWDDDFDVCIFEEDYEKAVECLTDKNCGLFDDVVLQCQKTDPNYYLGWMKIRDQRSHTYPDAPKFKENGVWIDLYKLMKVKESDVSLVIAQENVDYLKRRLSVGGFTQEEYDERIKNGEVNEKLKKAKEEQIIKSMSGANSYVYMICSASKVILKKEWIEPIRTVTFEGLDVTTFGKAEEYLKQHYGESFMEFPPDEMRRVGLTKIERF
jgi:lipopolysaccharide cholinephosphotransferase